MSKQELTQERLKELLHYDPETGVFTWRVGVSNVIQAGSTAGNQRGTGYCVIKVDGITYPASVLAWMYTYGVLPGTRVKHLDGDLGNNKVPNLKPASKVSEEPITQARLKELLHYDPDTGAFTWIETTSGKPLEGTRAGLLASNRYTKIGLDNRRYPSHRLAWLYVYGSFPLRGIDHINGDGRDNRINNLRECSQAENAQNSKLSCASSTGLRNVTFHKALGKFRSYITRLGKTQHLGYFDTKDAAYSAYLAAKARLHTFQPTPRDA